MDSNLRFASAWAYAKENGLNQQTFKKWTKPRTATPPCFVEIPIAPIYPPATKSTLSVPEIQIEKGDVRIRIPLGINCTELRAVMEGLGAVL